MKPKTNKKDIAIIGMSGKFPKSQNVSAFWKNLEAANELIDFYSSSELEALGVSANRINDANYVNASSLIEEPGSFDYNFFGYTKEEAALMDPQIRILHEQVWNSLEDAGYNPYNYSNKIGCFFSASDNVNWRTHVMLSETSNVNPFFVNNISNVNSISRLISYSLDLKGPSYFLDTACSSSLVAIHLACRNLLLKECAIALAGGISVSSTTEIGYIYQQGGIYSKDGHCKAFDNEASGTLAGEGVGVVVLKRLEDALNDKDQIYSVIKASAVNNDGNRKVGYTAPSISGQYECIKLAQQIAGVEPTDISYIETHGTGTKLGDPVEIEALNKAFNYDSTHKCAIGSLKTNIGHLDAAAGVAGLMKTALALKHKSIPPSLHFKTPNPQINFDTGPFYVNAKRKDWESEESRLAGVSSFGIGGTNVHAILQEPPVQDKEEQTIAYQLLLIAAKTKSSIDQFQQNLKVFLQENQQVNLSDLAYTLKSRRNNYRYKKCLVVQNTKEATELLDQSITKTPNNKTDKKGIVFMFSGQGSQYYEIGKQIYKQYPYVKSLMDQGFEILEKETGIDYKNIIGYHENAEGERNDINNTIYTQPLLFLLEYSFAKFLLNIGVKPAQMIGHSLGEYVAACISEVFTFEQGLKLVVKRAQLMNNMEKGTMLYVQLPANEVSKLIPVDVSIAAINTTNSCVISGGNDSIEAISDKLKAKDIIVAILKTSHAFHSEMMEGMLQDFEAELDKVEFSAPKYPFISCITGLPIKNEEAIAPKYWVKHLRETVEFDKGLNFLLEQGFSTYVEIGSAKTLLSFLEQHKKYNTDMQLAAVMRHPKEKKDDSYYLLTALGKLWNSGVTIDWNQYYDGQSPHKISAPTYAFDKIIFPARVNPIKRLVEQNGLNKSGERALKDLEYQFSINEAFTDSESVNETSTLANNTTERPELKSIYTEAESETEKELTKLWKSLFGYEKIGVNDDFFELGGDSLKALTLLTRIHKTFNVEIRVDDFFERCDIRELANEIDLAKGVNELNANPKKSSNSKQIRF